VHRSDTRDAVVALLNSGLNDCAISRRLGIPRSTVRDWRRPSYVRTTVDMTCPRCWRPVARPFGFADADYAELLGLYLGDGHIVRTGRSDRLRIFLDTRYEGIVTDARDLLARCFPGRRVGWFHSKKGTTTILSLYCTHLACVFPQHGPGRKHSRAIVLERWQRRVLERAPWAFLRGCIRSDGCVFVNRTGRYSYVSYDFKNRSGDILGLFAEACEIAGVDYRRYSGHIRIYRRASVARMLEHVGIKE
jgi:hypothetical protein